MVKNKPTNKDPILENDIEDMKSMRRTIDKLNVSTDAWKKRVAVKVAEKVKMIHYAKGHPKKDCPIHVWEYSCDFTISVLTELIKEILDVK